MAEKRYTVHLGSGMGRVFAVALSLWGLPIALIGGLPALPVAVAALVTVGLSNTLLNISGYTLLQRGLTMLL